MLYCTYAGCLLWFCGRVVWAAVVRWPALVRFLYPSHHASFPSRTWYVYPWADMQCLSTSEIHLRQTVWCVGDCHDGHMYKGRCYKGAWLKLKSHRADSPIVVCSCWWVWRSLCSQFGWLALWLLKLFGGSMYTMIYLARFMFCRLLVTAYPDTVKKTFKDAQGAWSVELGR